MKKILMLLLILTLVMIPMPNIAKAQTNSKEEAELYISNARELKEFATLVNNGNDYAGKTIKLTKDIVFDSLTVNNFTPIGYDKSFNGTFDGAGYTISGIDITDTDGSYDYLALFGYVGESGIVENINIKESCFTTYDGYCTGSIVAFNHGVIDNCRCDVNISINNNFSEKPAGGIAAYSDGKIKNCINNSRIIINDVSSGYMRIGGIAGENEGTIDNCCNLGDISNTNSTGILGGIVGLNYEGNDVTVQNCYNVGSLMGDGRKAGIVCFAGGIVSNCFYSEESAELRIFKLTGAEKNNKALPVSEMKASAFTDSLNINSSKDTSWLKWVNGTESEYPTLIKLSEVTFKNIKNAEIKTNKSYAYEGQVVTLSSKVDKNYKLSKIMVNTLDGEAITVKNVKGKYKFTMPAEKVVVSAELIHSNLISVKSYRAGKITADYITAFEGQAVNLVTTANNGYKLSKIAVTTVRGKKITVTKVNGKYQFVMPNEKVVVSASFIKNK